MRRQSSDDGICLEAAVGGDHIAAIDASSADLHGRAVLIRTGWDERWVRPQYWEPGPYLGLAALEMLITAGVAVVGVDFWNVDDPSNPETRA